MYKNQLTAEERAILLDLLSNKASDDILLDAAREANAANKRIKEAMKEFAVAEKPAPQRQRPVMASTTTAPTPPAAIEPPGEAASRITTTTKTAILKYIAAHKAATANEINQHLNGKIGNTQRALKKLWETGDLQFDGKHFFK